MAGTEEREEEGDLHSTGPTFSGVRLLSVRHQQQMVNIKRKARKEMSSPAQNFSRKKRQASWFGGHPVFSLSGLEVNIGLILGHAFSR